MTRRRARSGEAAPAAPTLGALAGYFLRLGTFGFGGPIALVGYMQRDLVEERGWIGESEYREGLALSQLAPGPLAAQLACYLGWVRGGIAGATVAGLAFVLPSFLMVLALSAAYVRYGTLEWMQGAFYGIAAAVIAIVARSVVKLVKLGLARDRLLWGVFAINAIVVAWTESEILLVFVASGVLLLVVRGGWRGGRWPGDGSLAALAAALAPSLGGALAAPASAGLLWEIFVFFAKGGAVVFGSGLAIVPFLYGGVVQQFGWLTERQFIDAVAVSMITPGPVVITVAFIGYLTAGIPGAAVAAIGVFLPVFVITVVAAPHVHRVAADGRVKAFVEGVTAAATGAITGAAFVLARRAIVDVPTTVVAIVTLALLMYTRKVPEPLVIVAAGVVGVVIRGVVQ